MSTYTFLTSCVHGDVDALEAMIDRARQITWPTFRHRVPLGEIEELFPTYSYRGVGLHIKDDWAVSFWKSKYKGQLCYYLEHSCIEYIWTEIEQV